MSDSVTLNFELEKETKNTVRFKEVTDGEPIVGTLYVKKGNFEGAKNLQVTINKTELQP